MTDTAMEIWREAKLAFSVTADYKTGDEAAAAVIARHIPKVGDGLVERLLKKLRSASQGDRMYERPMEWDEADQLLAYIAQLEARCERMAGAGNKLSFAAQTSGGVAGRDEGLIAAIDGWARHRQAGVQQGLDMAAGVADNVSPLIATAIRKLGANDETD